MGTQLRSVKNRSSSELVAEKSKTPNLCSGLVSSYGQKTPALVKALDIYLLFCLFTGISQAVYYFIAGSHQYNAFLGGFISSVGSFVLAANLRLKESISTQSQYSSERLIAEFTIGTVVLNLFVANFI